MVGSQSNEYEIPKLVLTDVFIPKPPTAIVLWQCLTSLFLHI